jgi:predicted transcriptional regulator
MAKHLGTQKSIRFSDDEVKLLDRLAKRHGSIKAAVMAGLHALEARNDLTREQVLDWLKRNI